MSCHNCCSEFRMFKKEYGCESCGYAFCSRCISKKTITNEAGNKFKPQVQLLCNSCIAVMSGGKSAKVSHSSVPLSALEKRLAFGKHSFSLDTQPRAVSSDTMNVKDKEIAERLQKLKRERNKELLPSELEIEERLAKLKGMDPAKYTAPPIMVYRPTDKRTVHEQANDLIKEVEAEVRIDSSTVKPEDEIAERLARLRGVDPTTRKFLCLQSPEDTVVRSVCQEVGNDKPHEEMDIDKASASFHKESEELKKLAQQDISGLNQEEFGVIMETMKKRKLEDKGDISDEDDEDEANELIQKFLSTNIEDEMEDPVSLDSTKMPTQDRMSKDKTEDSDEAAPEEFPWCVICTEDARLRCFDCDGDLYCMRCFRECHDSLDIKDHKTCPFLSPKV